MTHLPDVALTADEIKMVLLHYYRKRRMIAVTEMYMSEELGVADVFAFNPASGLTIEVEIKVSLSDLYNELSLTRGKIKHRYLSGDMQPVKVSTANLFYFCVPYTMQEKVSDILERSKCVHAGLMVCDPINKRTMAGCIRIVKFAPWLTRKKKTSEEMYEMMNRVAFRMFFENVTMQLKLSRKGKAA